ncbi:MAG: TIGR03936 family radical SAM-associated protein [Marmoricola sp.]
MSKTPPPQQPPPVQRLRIHYAKRGRMRFTSHRDFSRAFERAVLRARVPMAYSSGFHPHPRISYAGAAPTGSASEAEYLEIALAQVMDPAEIAASLAESLPDGLDIVEVVPVGSAGSLGDRLEASTWRLRLDDVDREAVEAAAAALLAESAVPVSRMTKKGLREFDVRAAVVSLEVTEIGETCVILDVVLRHGVPTVRPDDVLAGMRAVSGFEADSALFQRLAQGTLEDAGTVGDPLAPDRDAPSDRGQDG